MYLVQSNYNTVNYNTFDRNQEAIVEVDCHGNDLSNNSIISFVIDNALIFTGVIIGILSVVAVIAMKSVTQAKKKKELELISGTDELKRKLDIREQFAEKGDEKLIEAAVEARKSMEQIYFSVFSQKTVPPDNNRPLRTCNTLGVSVRSTVKGSIRNAKAVMRKINPFLMDLLVFSLTLSSSGGSRLLLIRDHNSR